MSCMCGDICCPSCGPAQGNARCPLCRAFASDGCVHVNEDTGELKPEFEAEVAANAAAETEAERLDMEYLTMYGEAFDDE